MKSALIRAATQLKGDIDLSEQTDDDPIGLRNEDKADDERSIKRAARRCLADKTNHRMRSVLAFSDDLSRRALFSLMGRQWNTCLDLSLSTTQLREVAEMATPAELEAMMTEEERELWNGLPEEFSAYRACYRPDVFGLRWSLGRTIASKYPFLPHLRQERSPLLAEARVRRADCVLKLQADEIEIVIWSPKVASVEQLPPFTH